jgi:hypothetical protein
MNTYLKDDGSPDLGGLSAAFKRCQSPVAGGMQWLDNVRDCLWPQQWSDGKRHDVPNDPNGEALPWDGASDCRPFLVDDIINERADVDVVAFWRAMLQQGAAGDEDTGYAIALAEWLIFTKLPAQLLDEVELSAQYRHHYGWCVLAPRWIREIGLKRYTLTLDQIRMEAAQPQVPADSPLKKLESMILDPTAEAAAVDFLAQWYEDYIQRKLPADMQARAPKIKRSTVRRCVQDLRTKQTCTAPMPYLCKNEPEISALKPYEEAFIPPELTGADELVFQVEWVSDTELEGRKFTEDYDADWIAEAIKQKGQGSQAQLPVRTQMLGLAAQFGGGTTPTLTGATGEGARMPGQGLIQVVHAIYRAPDEDGIPGVYMTTFHVNVTKLKGASGAERDGYAKHGLADSVNGELDFVGLVREKRARAVTASRGIPEVSHTDQNLVKGIRDGIIDRQSITLLPPVNVYDSPLQTKYKFGPAKQNYTSRGREPAFMTIPSGQGLADAVETHNLVTTGLDNRFGRMGTEVSPVRIQITQEKNTRRFLMGWTLAVKKMLCLYQKYGDDAEFAQVTGAPAGWLEQHREQPGALTCALDFDSRELDPELTMKRLEAFLKIGVPNDVMGVYRRPKLSEYIARATLGPAAAKQIVQPMPDASQALRDKAGMEVLKMFAGNPPNFVDKDDPTAAALLQYTKEILMSNRNYMRSLSDEALTALAGQNAPQIAQQLGPRQPDPQFSGLLLKWLENLQFLGVTQQQNKQIGRIGVNPQQTAT